MRRAAKSLSSPSWSQAIGTSVSTPQKSGLVERGGNWRKTPRPWVAYAVAWNGSSGKSKARLDLDRDGLLQFRWRSGKVHSDKTQVIGSTVGPELQDPARTKGNIPMTDDKKPLPDNWRSVAELARALAENAGGAK